MNTLLRDLRQCFRSLVRSPVFTLTAVLTLALSIGCATSIFSVFNALILHPLPYPDPGSLLHIQAQTSALTAYGPLSLPDAKLVVDDSRVFRGAGFYGSAKELNLTGAKSYAQVKALAVSPGIFDALDVAPRLGRWLEARDAKQGNDHVVVLSYQFWARQFGLERRAVGKTIRFDNKPYRIVGVMPQQFKFPSPAVEAWVPEMITPSAGRERNIAGTTLIARLAPGVSLQRAQTYLSMLADRIARNYPEWDAGLHFNIVRLQDEAAGPVRRIVLVLMGAVGLILLIAYANVANLLLARNARRRHELALRIALGAGRLRLVRIVMMESLVLAVLGGGAGLAVGLWALDAFRAVGGESMVALNSVTFNGWVFGFAAVISIVSAVLFGVGPSLRASKLDLNTALKDSASAALIVRGTRLNSQRILGVAQVALAVLLLTAAGLMIHSLSELINAPLGFNPHHLLWAEFRDQPTWSDSALLSYDQQLLNAARAVPGVRSAALGSNKPIYGGSISTSFYFLKQNRGWTPSPLLEREAVTPEYFRTVGIPIERGRDFTGQDTRGGPCVAILNEVAARELWRGESAVGERINLNSPTQKPYYCQIIGEAGDANFGHLGQKPGPTIYYSSLQFPQSQPMLVVRTTRNALAVANSVFDRVASLNKHQQIAVAFSTEQLINLSARSPRLRAGLLSLLSGLALVIAAVGIYGVTAYFVSQRTKEIGIRVALGAQHNDLIWLIMGRGLLDACVGLVIGMTASFAMVGVISKFLYGVRPTDPLTYTGVVATVLCLTALATYVPSRRAANVDPIQALRCE